MERRSPERALTICTWQPRAYPHAGSCHAFFYHPAISAVSLAWGGPKNRWGDKFGGPSGAMHSPSVSAMPLYKGASQAPYLGGRRPDGRAALRAAISPGEPFETSGLSQDGGAERPSPSRPQV